MNNPKSPCSEVNKEKRCSLREIYPGATPEHLWELEDAIDRYITMVMEIHDRIATDPIAYADLETAIKERRAERLSEQ